MDETYRTLVNIVPRQSWLTFHICDLHASNIRATAAIFGRMTKHVDYETVCGFPLIPGRGRYVG